MDSIGKIYKVGDKIELLQWIKKGIINQSIWVPGEVTEVTKHTVSVEYIIHGHKRLMVIHESVKDTLRHASINREEFKGYT